MIVSNACTIDPAKPQDRREIIVNNIRRAYIYAKQQRHVFIDVPRKTTKLRKERSGSCCFVFYGTRDAVKEWQKTSSKHLQDSGFILRRGHPAVLHHPERDMRVLVHGDDYLTSRHVGDLD